MGFTMFRGIVALLAAVVVVCSIVIAAIIGIDGQDQGPQDQWDCMYFISDDDWTGRTSACEGGIGVSVVSLFFGIAVIVTLFFTNMQLGLITLISSGLWTVVWFILAAYLTAGWNETCDTFNDCETVCELNDVDYDALNSTIAMSWITSGAWGICTLFLWLTRRQDS